MGWRDTLKNIWLTGKPTPSAKRVTPSEPLPPITSCLAAALVRSMNIGISLHSAGDVPTDEVVFTVFPVATGNLPEIILVTWEVKYWQRMNAAQQMSLDADEPQFNYGERNNYGTA